MTPGRNPAGPASGPGHWTVDGVELLGVAGPRPAAQSTQWIPTAAGRWHSVQVGSPHRWQRMNEGRSGWRGQTGNCRSAPPTGPPEVWWDKETQASLISMDSMETASRGLSRPSVATEFRVSTIFFEASSFTSPKMVCLPCSHVVGTVVMKN